MTDDLAFLGTGWRFPPLADPATGRVALASHGDDIQESIRIILGTRRGERVMRPEFGSLLHTFVFEGLSLSVTSRIAEEVKNSLTLWEPRIRDIQADVTPGSEGAVHINVSYVVRATNNPYNLVYPFYLNEGSHV